MLSRISAFLKDEEGQGLVEYGLIVGLISVMLIGGLAALKGGLTSIFSNATSTLNDPASAQ